MRTSLQSVSSDKYIYIWHFFGCLEQRTQGKFRFATLFVLENTITSGTVVVLLVELLLLRHCYSSVKSGAANAGLPSSIPPRYTNLL